MGEIAVGRGNWANASARSKARKANLLNETQMRQLMMIPVSIQLMDLM